MNSSSQFSFKFGNGELVYPRFSIISRALIEGLFCSGCPSEIFWGIRTVVINTIYRTVRRTLAYIGKKIYELKPSPTYFDSPCSVPFIGCSVRVVASIVHVTPNKIERVVGLAVRMMTFCATAGTTITRQQMSGLNNAAVAADALTKPPSFVVFFVGTTKDYKPTKSSIYDINCGGHRAAPTVRGQVTGSMLQHRSRCAILA